MLAWMQVMSGPKESPEREVYIRYDLESTPTLQWLHPSCLILNFRLI
jgi:hypothetical protein